jgi:transposase-like protein
VSLLIKKDKCFRKLKLHINILLKTDIYKGRNIERCPKCGKTKFIKHGLYNGIQRYRCKECGKTFSQTTNSLWSYSKKEASKWIKFTEYVMERKSLRFCAKKLEISLVTAFYWRHKVLHGLAFDNVPSKLSGDVYVAKKLIPENFKGSRNITTNIRHNIWVVGAKGIEDSMLAKPISRGFWDFSIFNKIIYPIIDRKAYIVPYGDRYISIVAEKHNKKRIKKVIDENKIKFFHNNLEKWLKKYYGVATKYLDEYLSLFIISNIEKKVNYMEVFKQLFLGNRFIKIKEIGMM